MSQSQASVSSFMRDMSWDDLASASSPSERTLVQDETFVLVASPPPPSKMDGGGGRQRLEIPTPSSTPGGVLNRTFNVGELLDGLSVTGPGTFLDGTSRPLNRTFRVRDRQSLENALAGVPLGK